MPAKKLKVDWTTKAEIDLQSIYYNLLEKNSAEISGKIRNDIFAAPNQIVFPEQFQFDEYRKDFRRIVVRNFKILYETNGDIVTVITIIDCRRLPSKI